MKKHCTYECNLLLSALVGLAVVVAVFVDSVLGCVAVLAYTAADIDVFHLF